MTYQFSTRSSADRFATREQRAGYHSKVSRCVGGVSLAGLRSRYEYWVVSTTRPVGTVPSTEEQLEADLRLEADFARPFPF